MLVLTRKKDEGIFIGPHIHIMVIDIVKHRNCARIGIEAPSSIKVWRDELPKGVLSDSSAVKAGHRTAVEQFVELLLESDLENSKPEDYELLVTETPAGISYKLQKKGALVHVT